ncbi:MAG TPA: TonB-dependent receptor [Fimbriimonadaceae bacterium]|nr:TonB-dependent receptor [Fimbriimonadaceae bacterium]
MQKLSALVVATCLCVVALGDDESGKKNPAGQDLTQLGLEDLMKIEVTTASKSAQPWLRVPAAVYVITGEEIERSGVTTLPDALRLAPGVHVVRVDSSKWQVSIRGFTSRFANKLLVLIDGRTVYTPLFSGVYWESQDLPLQDVDRIEVIRGPGGSLWGANAVNGIINIITKKSSDTQGLLASALVGTEDRFEGLIRYGGQISDETFYRIYAKYTDRDSSATPSGGAGSDRWSATQVGTRFDWQSPSGESLMLRADVRGAHLGQTTNRPVIGPPFVRPTDDRFPAGNWSAVARWELPKPSGTTAVQAYFDRNIRKFPEIEESRSTFEIDAQHEFPRLGRHRFMLGASYRQSMDLLGSTALASVPNPSRTDHLWGAFLQDDIQLSSKAELTLGAKLERNSYSGFEVQPNARISYFPHERLTLWGSVARAVRTPSRVEHDAAITFAAQPGPGGLPVLLRLLGSRDFDSEKLVAYEAGARWQANDRLLLDAAFFYNVYSGLRTFRAGAPFMEVLPGPPHLVAPLTFSNGLSGDTAGFELMAQAQVNPRWRVTGSYSFLSTRFRIDPTLGDPFGNYGGDGRGSTPRHLLKLQSHYDLSRGVEIDAGVHYVGPNTRGMAAYWIGDLHLGWRTSPSFKLDFGLQNAFAPRQLQAGEALFERIHEVERALYVRATWRF